MFLLATAALGQIFSCDDSTTWNSSFDGRQNPAGAGAGYVGKHASRRPGGDGGVDRRDVAQVRAPLDA